MSSTLDGTTATTAAGPVEREDPAGLRDVVLAALTRIAPDADLAALDPSGDLRDALELDSMDFLNVVTAVGERLGVEIPERDYPKLVSLDGFVSYLARR